MRTTQRPAVMPWLLEVEWFRTRRLERIPVRTREIGEILKTKYVREGAVVRLVERSRKKETGT